MRLQRNKKASDEQKEFLLSYMEKNPMFAQDKYIGADAAHRRSEEWTHVSKLLNAIEGAHKDGTKWRKYWMDQRGHIKEREALLKANYRPNGQKGPVNLKPLNDFEKRMLRLFARGSAYQTSYLSDSSSYGQEIFVLEEQKNTYAHADKQEQLEELQVELAEEEFHDELEAQQEETSDEHGFTTEFVTCAPETEDENSLVHEVVQPAAKRLKLSTNETVTNKASTSKHSFISVSSLEEEKLKLEIAKFDAETNWKKRNYELEFRKLELENKRIDLENRKLDFEIAKYEFEKTALVSSRNNGTLQVVVD